MELKPGYKLTEIGVIPEKWELSTLKAVCVDGGLVRGPFGGALKKEYFVEEGYKVYEQRNAIYRSTELGNYYVTPEKFSELRRFEVHEGDFIVSCSGTIGKIFQIPSGAQSGIINQALLKITVDSRRMTDAFFYHYFDWEECQERIVDNTQGGAMQNLVGMSLLKELPIPLPPLAEQQAIAAALSDVDALIDALDHQIAKQRDLKQGAMQELLTGQRRLPGFTGAWETYMFGDLFEFLPTANSPRSDLSPYGQVAYVHYGDIHTKGSAFLDGSVETLPRIEASLVANLPFVADGDLIMADASEDYAGVGVSVEVRNVGHARVVAGLHTLLLRGKPERVANGFKGYLQFIPSVKADLIRLATGISVFGITKNSVRSVQVELPPLAEQQAIAAVLSDMDAEIAALEAQRDKTRALKQGMMQELLTGRTRLI